MANEHFERAEKLITEAWTIVDEAVEELNHHSICEPELLETARALCTLLGTLRLAVFRRAAEQPIES